jgi:hypothetical protein
MRRRPGTSWSLAMPVSAGQDDILRDGMARPTHSRIHVMEWWWVQSAANHSRRVETCYSAKCSQLGSERWRRHRILQRLCAHGAVGSLEAPKKEQAPNRCVTGQKQDRIWTGSGVKHVNDLRKRFEGNTVGFVATMASERPNERERA